MDIETEYAEYSRRVKPTGEARREAFEEIVSWLREMFAGTELTRVPDLKAPWRGKYNPVLSFTVRDQRFFLAMPEEQRFVSLLFQGKDEYPETASLFLSTTTSKESDHQDIHRKLERSR